MCEKNPHFAYAIAYLNIQIQSLNLYKFYDHVLNNSLGKLGLMVLKEILFVNSCQSYSNNNIVFSSHNLNYTQNLSNFSFSMY